jgi:hypothetical protein
MGSSEMERSSSERSDTDPEATEVDQATGESMTDRTTGSRWSNRWARGAIAGLVGGLAFGVVLQGVGAMPTIGALYGVQSTVAGWVVHMFHSLVFGLVFAAMFSRAPLAKYAGNFAYSTAVGATYGAVLWLVAAGVVMPLWLGFVGIQAPLPNLDPISLAGHLAYGVVLGVLFPAIAEMGQPARAGRTTT